MVVRSQYQFSKDLIQSSGIPPLRGDDDDAVGIRGMLRVQLNALVHVS